MLGHNFYFIDRNNRASLLGDTLDALKNVHAYHPRIPLDKTYPKS